MSQSRPQYGSNASNEPLTAMAKWQDLLASIRSDKEDTTDTAMPSEPPVEVSKSDSQYRVINMAHRAKYSGPYKGTVMYHPLDLILAITNQPAIAEEVEEISFLPSFNSNEYNNDGTDSAEDDEEDEDGEGDRNTKIKLAWSTMSSKLQALKLDDIEEQRWMWAVENGNDSAWFTILLCMPRT